MALWTNFRLTRSDKNSTSEGPTKMDGFQRCQWKLKFWSHTGIFTYIWLICMGNFGTYNFTPALLNWQLIDKQPSKWAVIESWIVYFTIWACTIHLELGWYTYTYTYLIYIYIQKVFWFWHWGFEYTTITDLYSPTNTLKWHNIFEGCSSEN